jgi:hypothetical protein
MKFKIGDKVKIPTQLKHYDYGTSLEKKSAVQAAKELKHDFLYVESVIGDRVCVTELTKSVKCYSLIHEDDLELYEEPLPEKWAISIKDDKDGQEVCDWLNKNKQINAHYNLPAIAIQNFIIHYPAYCDNTHILKCVQKGYTEIDFETFRKITNMSKEIELKVGLVILNENKDKLVITEIYKNDIYYKFNNYGIVHQPIDFVKNMFNKGYWSVEKERKIKGYKAPMDLYGGKVKKGDLYIQEGNKDYYNTNKAFSLPKELVETWEAVYEDEEKIILLGDKNTEVKIGRGYIKTDSNVFPINEVKRLLNSLQFKSISGYNIEFPLIKIACNTLKTEELQLIIDTYNELN